MSPLSPNCRPVNQRTHGTLPCAREVRWECAGNEGRLLTGLGVGEGKAGQEARGTSAPDLLPWSVH